MGSESMSLDNNYGHAPTTADNSHSNRGWLAVRSIHLDHHLRQGSRWQGHWGLPFNVGSGSGTFCWCAALLPAGGAGACALAAAEEKRKSPRRSLMTTWASD
ncbi:hypothetical protein BASA61_002078 [Batrachochytrium salamandrivorans]|nr:hypothetical protein BASA61_002078 [Batrachochytrium salamandrivorans]